MNRTRTCLAVALLLTCTAPRAHDTWFEPLPASTARQTEVALGTGNQFPKQDSSIGAEYLVAQGCDAPDQPPGTLVMKALRNTDTALLLSVPKGARSCWMQLTPFEVTVAPDKVPVYLKEIQASAEQRAMWAAIEKKGLPWHERYTKHARVEIGAAGASATPDPVTPLGMDLRLIADDGPLRVGSQLTAVVLRDGLPLVGQAIELRSAVSPLGIWGRSDEQGRISVRVPLPGRWVLRGVDLRLSTSVPDQWESRFVTLAFDVPPAGRP